MAPELGDSESPIATTARQVGIHSVSEMFQDTEFH